MSDRTRRETLASAGVVIAAALAGCGDAGVPGDEDEERVDRTGEETVDVVVGSDGGFGFDPANVVVDVGTTLRWEWNGDGGAHNVVEVNDAFESELVDEAGFTFEYTFDEPGTFEYVCTPHQTQGMVGVVEVVE